MNERSRSLEEQDVERESINQDVGEQGADRANTVPQSQATAETPESVEATTVPRPMERPVIFSGEMVRALLDGRKTQTRRIIKTPSDLNQPAFYLGRGWRFTRIRDNGAWPGPNKRRAINWLRCPYGVAGDRLWVREAWMPRCTDSEELIQYRSDGALREFPKGLNLSEDLLYEFVMDDGKKWRPSIHMPRRASRITLEITKVRTERLQDISEKDAKAEGMTPSGRRATHRWSGATGEHVAYRRTFRVLWDSLHGKGAWDRNDWVWAIEFRRIDNQ